MSEAVPDPGFGPAQFALSANVSRETLRRLEHYVAVLTQWNSRTNLVSARSLRDVWQRHVWDSAQLIRYIPEHTKTLVDLGSGAGFPGIVLALMMRKCVHVTLMEATTKKADFLQFVVRELNLSVSVCNERIEARRRAHADVITARALAPLDRLLDYAQHFAAQHTVCLFLKGQSVVSELTEVRKSWRMKTQQHQSLSSPSGIVLEIRELRHAGKR